jgi:hypothetical protein
MLAITRLIDVFAVHACVDEAADNAGRIPAAIAPKAGNPRSWPICARAGRRVRSGSPL